MGLAAIVDDDVYEWASKITWHISNNYAEMHREGKQQRLHVMIMNPPPGMQVDHIDGDRLDNRRYNLRLCLPSENKKNIWRRNKTGYKGVTYVETERGTKKYKASIKVNYKQMHIGGYRTAEEAAQAYNEAAKKYFGEFARLNVIPQLTIPPHL